MTDRLYRSRRDRMLAGVAGGLAEMWDADPSLVRIVWALLVIFTGGIALVVYIVMAIVVPEEDDGVAGWSQWPAPPAPPAGSPAAHGTPMEPAEGQAPGAAPAATGSAPAATGAATAWIPPSSARDQARAARHEARAARQAARRERGYNGGAIIGIILVGLGIYFLGREWLPQIDFDWFWPLILVAVGVVLLVSALTRRPDDPGGAP
jgi:phage shock protein C